LGGLQGGFRGNPVLPSVANAGGVSRRRILETTFSCVVGSEMDEDVEPPRPRDHSSYMTGALVAADGGYTAG